MRALVVVAHPDDEAIWMGGAIIRHPDWQWRVFSLCRADDPDRAPRFYRAAGEFGAEALISDLDDSPTLKDLSPGLEEIKTRVARLADDDYDLIFTHGERGEYTRHRRHEEVHRAVVELIESGQLRGRAVFFTYDDCGGACSPRPAPDAEVIVHLTDEEFARKRRIVEEIYGFVPDSFEYRSAGQVEAFRISDLPSLQEERDRG